MLSPPFSCTAYAVEGFGETPGTLWVWVPGRPDGREQLRILEGLQPSKPPAWRAGDRAGHVNDVLFAR
jgi:hypothetical protein